MNCIEVKWYVNLQFGDYMILIIFHSTSCWESMGHAFFWKQSLVQHVIFCWFLVVKLGSCTFHTSIYFPDKVSYPAIMIDISIRLDGHVTCSVQADQVGKTASRISGWCHKTYRFWCQMSFLDMEYIRTSCSMLFDDM